MCGPTVMALLRDAVVSLLHHHGVKQVAARLRAHSQHPQDAIAMVVGPSLLTHKPYRVPGFIYLFL